MNNGLDQLGNALSQLQLTTRMPEETSGIETISSTSEKPLTKTTQVAKTTFDSLPNQLYRIVGQFLSLRDKLAFRSVSKCCKAAFFEMFTNDAESMNILLRKVKGKISSMPQPWNEIVTTKAKTIFCLSLMQFQSGALKELSVHFKHITSLIDCYGFSNEDVIYLEKFTELRKLHLNDCTAITQDRFANIQWPSLLEEIELKRTKIDDSGLYTLCKKATQLQKIILCHNPITNDGCVKAPWQATLKEVSLAHIKIGDSGLIALCEKATRLCNLNLNLCCTITIDGFKNALWPATLKEILLDCTNIEDSGLQNLCGTATRLEHLSLSLCNALTNNGFVKALWPVTLEEIVVSKTKMADRGLFALCQRATQLRRIDLKRCEDITNTGFERAPWSLTLEEANFSLTKVGNSGLTAFFQKATQLREVDLSWCDAITQEGFVNAPWPSTLEQAHLFGTEIGDMGKEILRQKAPKIRIFG